MKVKDRIFGLKAEALEFSPAILRIEREPPSPLPRLVLYVSLGVVAAALLWAAFGRLDVIAVAQGKLVPQNFVQVVQPSDAGIVKELLVREGDQVRAGQVLIRMDTSVSEADNRILRNELDSRNLQLRRIDAELAGIPLARRSGDPTELFEQVEAQYRARRQAYRDQLEGERALLARAQADLRSAIEIEGKLKRTVPMYKDQADSWQKLAKEGFAGRLLALDRERAHIEVAQELRAQENVVAGLQAAIAQSGKRIAQITSNYRQQLQNERIEAEAQYQRLRQNWEKQQHRHMLLELKAPQDGVIKDLATYTAGSVVSAGTILMTLVPLNDPLLAEVWVSHLDAGFVRPGQSAKLKFTTYPFQRYGMLEGKVKHISPDAAGAAEAKPDRKSPEQSAPNQGYRTLIALSASMLERDDRRYRLFPGMQLSAELNLGNRTVLEYLLSPIQKTVGEAGRER